MSDSGKHFLVGAGMTGGAYLLYCWARDREPTGTEFFGAAVLGGFCAQLPDILEPAVHPNHRQFFHSLAALGLLTYGNYKALTSCGISDGEKVGILVGSVGYASHLAMDSVTPKSLPAC